jgi:hypothetical protein
LTCDLYESETEEKGFGSYRRFGIEDSVVIAIHSHKRHGVCQSYFGVRICAEEELDHPTGTAQSMLNELYSVHCQLRSC